MGKNLKTVTNRLKVLEDGYKQMAMDNQYEAGALEWSEAMIGDIGSWIHVYVVFRIDHYLIEKIDKVNNNITIKEVLLSSDEAAKEVERLTSLETDRARKKTGLDGEEEKSTYHFQSAKFYPNGRKIQLEE